MKRIFLSLMIILFASSAKSQSVTTYYKSSDKYIELRDIMETRDGNIVINCPIFGDENNSHIDLGTCLYKISKQGELLDSLFIEDHDMTQFLLAPNPIDENNIFAKILRDFDNGKSWLKIRFFTDNSLEIQDEISVLLHDTIIRGGSYYLDSDNDIIFTYSASQQLYMSRVGLDGTLKDKNMLPESSIDVVQYRHLGLYNDTPREYCMWGVDSHDSRAIYNVVVDSTLNFVSEIKFSSVFQGQNNEQIMYYNDSTYILSSFYTKYNPYTHGVHLTKFNKNNEDISTVRFTEDDASPWPIWSEKATDGGLYYSYVRDAVGKQVVVVKMDDDFNVCWKRYCLESGPFHWGRYMLALSDGGVAVGGFDSSSGPDYFRVFLLILQDDGTPISETANTLRPYLAYPNPASDHICLDISPDSVVESIILYDLSGRIIKTQSNSFENVDISGFAPGVYVMKVVLQNGKTYEEKIVKK